MENRQITIPKMKSGELTSVKVSQQELSESFKRRVDQIPKLIATMKHMDNEGWQVLLNDLMEYVERKPELAQLVRPAVVDGKHGLSIGEPNWTTVGVLGGLTGVQIAFYVGYAIGTACYDSGYCQFVD